MSFCLARFIVPVVVCLIAVNSADAAAIHFVNPSPPPQSQVIASVDNTASGATLGPSTLSQLTATSVAVTQLGPLPPPFTAIADGRAELASDLYLTSPGTTRTVTAPFSSLGFYAEGTGLTATDSYTANSDVYSGDTSSTLPGAWTIYVDPTGAEVAGTPTLITLDASIVGDLEVVGTATADASWLIDTNFGTVMSGSASQVVPGLTAFSDSGSISFTIPLGSSFQLSLLYELDAAGTGISNSRAEIFSSIVSPLFAGPSLRSSSAPPTTSSLTITAQVGVVPEPSSLALFGIGALGLAIFAGRRRAAD